MKILIADDDHNNRTVLQGMLSSYGECDMVVTGKEAYEAFVLAHEESKPYDLVCLDIMMPVMDGNEALVKMREYEKQNGLTLPSQETKIIMTTALDHPKDIIKAFYKGGCTAYLTKPITKKALVEQLKDIGVLS